MNTRTYSFSCRWNTRCCFRPGNSDVGLWCRCTMIHDKFLIHIHLSTGDFPEWTTQDWGPYGLLSIILRDTTVQKKRERDKGNAEGQGRGPVPQCVKEEESSLTEDARFEILQKFPMCHRVEMLNFNRNLLASLPSAVGWYFAQGYCEDDVYDDTTV